MGKFKRPYPLCVGRSKYFYNHPKISAVAERLK